MQITQDPDLPVYTSAWYVKIFEATSAHEQNVTGMIHALVDRAVGEKDNSAVEMLQWVVK